MDGATEGLNSVVRWLGRCVLDLYEYEAVNSLGIRVLVEPMKTTHRGTVNKGNPTGLRWRLWLQDLTFRHGSDGRPQKEGPGTNTAEASGMS